MTGWNRRNFLLGLGVSATSPAIRPITPPVVTVWQSALDANMFGNFPMMVIAERDEQATSAL